MRFNTDRRNRLAFDRVADAYEARPDIPRDVIDWCATTAGVAAGDTILEVGAGTGQLTAGLLERGLRVVAVEPGAELGARLAKRYSGTALDVVATFFEDVAPLDEPPASIWSANAFHWVAPDVGYPKAHELLAGHGTLVLLWTYLLVEDPRLAEILRTRVPGSELANFLPEDADTFAAANRETADGGRGELTSSGLFEVVDWAERARQLVLPASRYAPLLLSFANAAAAVADADAFTSSFAQALDAARIDEIAFTQHAYALVARTRG